MCSDLGRWTTKAGAEKRETGDGSWKEARVVPRHDFTYVVRLKKHVGGHDCQTWLPVRDDSIRRNIGSAVLYRSVAPVVRWLGYWLLIIGIISCFKKLDALFSVTLARGFQIGTQNWECQYVC
jgi:hypothetical protein